MKATLWIPLTLLALILATGPLPGCGDSTSNDPDLATQDKTSQPDADAAANPDVDVVARPDVDARVELDIPADLGDITSVAPEVVVPAEQPINQAIPTGVQSKTESVAVSGVSETVPLGPPEAIALAAKKITPEGGVIELEGMQFDVPPGAVENDTTISISETPLDSPEGIVGVTPIFRCEPSGIVFAQPVEVRLTFDGADAEDVKVLWSGLDGQPAEILDSTVDGNVITVKTNHCSILEGIKAGYELYEYFTDDCKDGCCPDGFFQCEGKDFCCENGSICTENDCVICPAGHKLCPGTNGCCPNDKACVNNQCFGCDAGKWNCEGEKCCPIGSSCLGVNKCLTCKTAGWFQCPGKESCCPPGSSCSPQGCVTCPAGYKYNAALDACELITCPGGVLPCGTSGACCGTGQTCSNGTCVVADVNECLTNNGGCDALTTCTNTSTYRICGGCPSGYSGTGDSGCSDINECLANNGGCHALTTCTNTPGSRTCGNCPAGYSGTGISGCVDINECQTGNGGCDPLTICTNTNGSRTCGSCPQGYSGSGDSGCSDINECLTDNGGCGQLTTCTNTPGGRTCSSCPNGYVGTGDTGCEDINECLTGNGGCDLLTTCSNIPGSRTCGACPNGYIGSGETGCSDLDECLEGNGGCHPLTLCTNIAGWRTCGPCPSGFSGDGESGCNDINECLNNNGGCDLLSVCTNVDGYRTCGACPNGYTGNGDIGCQDINECLNSNGGCHPLTSCTNTAGWRTCGPCPNGYSGNGEEGCQDINECLNANGGCHPLTSCINVDGSRACGACPFGYAGDGYVGCTDINECQTNNGGCDWLTTCTNTNGSWTCGPCPDGYSGNGDIGCMPNYYSLGGTVAGLNGTLTLQNGTKTLNINQNGAFAFPDLLVLNTAYSVTVSGQPIGQTCNVTNGSGVVGPGNVTSIQVVCTSMSYKISGVINGLYGDINLKNNGGDLLIRTSLSGGQVAFTFATSVPYMGSYNVTISLQPVTRICTVTNGSGVMGLGDVTNVIVECTDPTTAKRVFATSGTFNGSLANLMGADAKCQAAATAAGLTGTYRAYISGNDVGGSANSPTRMSHSSGFYYKMDGTSPVTVANDWNDFYTLEGSNYLRSPIDRDEFGQAVTGGAWTGTQVDGSYSSTSHHCNLWSNAQSNMYGLAGDIQKITSGWTHNASANCNISLRLYCFEQ